MRALATIVAALAAGTFATSAGAAEVCPGADATPTAQTGTAARTALGCLIDAARADAGRPALHRDARLRAAAQRYARALKPGRPLTHAGAGGSTPADRIARSGYGGGAFTAAEALGRGRGRVATPAARVKAWLADAGTRRLLLSARYRDIGIGVTSRGGVTTFVIELARKRG